MKPLRKSLVSRFGPPIANWSFAMMHHQVHSIQKRGVSMMHTARPFAYYRKVFYAHQSEAEVLHDLRAKRVVDVGCGYTPFADDSMFRVCFEHDIEFYGIDPLLESTPHFGFKERVLARALGSQGHFSADAPGLHRALAASAQDLPFESASVDEILCSYLLFVWIENQVDLAEILNEFARVLKPGGIVKLYPLHEWSCLDINEPQLQSVLRGFTIKQSFVHGGLDFRVTPAMLTSLTKVVSPPI